MSYWHALVLCSLARLRIRSFQKALEWAGKDIKKYLVLPDSVVLDVLHFTTHEISHFYHEIAPPV